MRMNRLLGLVLAFGLGLFPELALAAEFSLADGTPVQLKLLDSLSSRKNSEGNQAAFEVCEDVLAEDGKTVLIKAGMPAWGSVTHVEERGMIGQKGSISVELEGLKAVDGQRAPLRGHVSREGQSKQGTVMALGLLLSPLFLLMKGKDATLSTGTLLTGYVDRELRVRIPDEPGVASETRPDAGANLPDYMKKYAGNETSPPASAPQSESKKP